jgi:hypothetical protein
VSQFSKTAGPLVDDAVAFFERLRERGSVKRKISPAELIDWLSFILVRGGRMDRPLRAARGEAEGGIGALGKDSQSREAILKELQAFLA